MIPHASARHAAQVQHWGLAGGSAVGVAVDQQVLVEAEQGVVEGGVVCADFDAGQASEIAQVAAMQLNAAFESSRCALFLGAEPDRSRGLIAEQKAEADALVGLLLNGCGEVELFEQERAGVDEHVHGLVGAGDELAPGVVRHGGA